MNYRVAYEIGGRLFESHLTFVDIHFAIKLRDHFRELHFNSEVIPEGYNLHMLAGFGKYDEMLFKGICPPSNNRPETIA